jgi:hypothetical protein
LLWGGIAALVVGGAALGVFLLLGGGDGEGRFDEDDEDPTTEAVASVDARTSPSSTATLRTPTVTTGPGTPTPTPQPEPTSPPVIVTVTNSQGTAVAATATPTNTSVPPTNTNVPPTATNTSVPPTATNTSIPPTATNTTAAGLFVTITGIQLVNGQYRTFFTSNVRNNAAGDHLHFYLDPSTVRFRDFYYDGSQPYYDGFATWDNPGSATKLCAVVAFGNHTFQSTGGSCWPLPTQ